MQFLLQNDGYTRSNRYPGLFDILKNYVSDSPDTTIVSFGCSTGEELLTLASYFNTAKIVGLEIDPIRNEYAQRATKHISRIYVPSTVMFSGEADMVLALSVFCRFPAIEPLPFNVFDAAMFELVNLLRPGGYLVLLNSNYSLSTSRASGYLTTESFEVQWVQSVPQYSPDGALVETDKHFIFRKNL